jgi:hypothetical protein
MRTVQIIRSAPRALGHSSFVAFTTAGALLLLPTSLVFAYPQGPVGPDFYGGYDLPTLNSAPQLLEQFNGNVVSQFPTEPASDSADDPFANPSDITGGSVADANGGIGYDPGHNLTTNMYSGDPINTASTTVHAGFDFGAATVPRT